MVSGQYSHPYSQSFSIKCAFTLVLYSRRKHLLKCQRSPAHNIDLNGNEQGKNIERHADAAIKELTDWCSRLGGRGNFGVRVCANLTDLYGSSGIIEISFDREKTSEGRHEVNINDLLAASALAELCELGLHIIPTGRSLQLVPDMYVWIAGTLYVARPLIARYWTVRQASRDAERIVRQGQSQQHMKSVPEVA